MRTRRANIVGVALLGALALATAVAAQTPAHAALTWQGNGTCLTCHEQQGRDMHASAHYQWQGYAPYLTTGPALQGKLKTSFNSYCINILGNWGECSNCHVGRGLQPSTTATTEQLQDIDCLVCHQKNYKRVKVNGAFVPDTASMTITMDQAVQTVHLPERQNCIACHAKGGGGDNYKRGDLALAHANTADRNFDVHMATTGANLRCQSCHKVQNHLIAGRGSDLRETDYDADMSCTTCHTTKASATGHSTSAVNRHVARVACQTCHIRAYGRNAADTAASEATEVARDWSRPTEVSPGSFRPTSTMANNVKPVYRFWNKYSSGYSLGEPAVFDASTSAYATSRPIGSIDDSTGGGKLYPFKYKTSFQPMASAPAALVAVDTSVFFKTGDLAAATVAGLANMGLSTTQPTSMVTTDTYQLITHTVTPAANVLQCAECHSSTATQMSLPALGYVLKGTISSVCSQCHSARQSPGWQSVHDIHVTQRHYDCSRCHSFTRPERNSTSTTYTLSVTKAGTGAGTVTSSPAGINCGTTCSASYSSGTTVTLTAAAASGSTFAGWSGACSGTGTCTVTMSAARSVSATFNSSSSTYVLSVAKAGTGAGTVTSSPAGINCGTTCSATYTSGATVTLTAAAASGSTFAGWSGACSGTGTCTVTMSAARSVTATFNPSSSSTYVLSVAKAGTGAGTVTSSPAGINCGTTCSATLHVGNDVTLTAAAASGSTFAGWSGACSGTGTCTVTMSAARSVTATFNLSPATYTLSVATAGAGTGALTSSPAGINCGTACSAAYASGTAVTLTAEPGSGSSFAGWSGACSGTGTCTVTMSAARSVTATFKRGHKTK